jgi:hypothetical protein
MNKQLVDIISNFLESIGIDSSKMMRSENIDDEQIILRTKIHPTKAGPLAPIFDDIELTVKVDSAKSFLNDQMASLSLNYSYSHPGGGSNGKTALFVIFMGKVWPSQDWFDLRREFSKLDKS